MLKICAFFDGGMPYPFLEDMPIDEFNGVVKDANEIQRLRDIEMNKAK
jgi:hypothetical protein